jgi:hypothetical protein
LRQTDDRKEALRQYAKFEQKLHRASALMDQKRDEQYLERAAKELDKDRETKILSDKLKQKKYDAAASELSKMEPEQTKKLSERRKQLAKLRAAAKRMAAAAKRSAGKRSSTQQSKSSDQLAKTSKNSESEHAQRSNQEKSSANQSQSSKSQMAKMAQERANSNGKDQQSVEQLVSELQKNLDNLEQQLANAEMQEQEDGECDQEQLAKCEQCQGQAQKSLAKLSSKLGRMGMKLKMQSKLGMLAKACSQGQSELAGLTPGNNQGGASSMVQSPDAGGKKAGWGSSDTHRDERDALQDNGQYSQLKGQKGEGPSLTTLEAAEDGSGVSTAQGKAVSRNFQRQIESFVEREDVPDDVKNGVRNYFEMIHSNEQ